MIFNIKARTRPSHPSKEGDQRLFELRGALYTMNIAAARLPGTPGWNEVGRGAGDGAGGGAGRGAGGGARSKKEKKKKKKKKQEKARSLAAGIHLEDIRKKDGIDPPQTEASLIDIMGEVSVISMIVEWLMIGHIARLPHDGGVAYLVVPVVHPGVLHWWVINRLSGEVDNAIDNAIDKVMIHVVRDMISLSKTCRSLYTRFTDTDLMTTTYRILVCMRARAHKSINALELLYKQMITIRNLALKPEGYMYTCEIKIINRASIPIVITRFTGKEHTYQNLDLKVPDDYVVFTYMDATSELTMNTLLCSNNKTLQYLVRPLITGPGLGLTNWDHVLLVRPRIDTTRPGCIKTTLVINEFKPSTQLPTKYKVGPIGSFGTDLRWHELLSTRSVFKAIQGISRNRESKAASIKSDLVEMKVIQDRLEKSRRDFADMSEIKSSYEGLR